MAKGKYILNSPLEGIDAEVGSVIEWDEEEAAELPWAFQPVKEADVAPEKPEEPESEDEEEGDDEPETVEALVEGHTREELNELAEAAGVEDPESLSTKADVAKAILMLESEDENEEE